MIDTDRAPAGGQGYVVLHTHAQPALLGIHVDLDNRGVRYGDLLVPAALGQQVLADDLQNWCIVVVIEADLYYRGRR